MNALCHICDRVAVMYLGKIVETGTWEEIYDRPAHPYTQALLSATPAIDPTERRERIMLEGEVPSPMNPPSGCRFRTRCPMAESVCTSEVPVLSPLGPSHRAACHFAKSAED